MNKNSPAIMPLFEDSGRAQNQMKRSKVNIKDELDKIKSIIDMTQDMIST